MPAKIALVIALLLGIGLGLAVDPDSGTQASVGNPDVHGLVLGANHAKPLPRIASVAQRLGLLGLGSATIVALTVAAITALAAGAGRLASELDDGRHRSVFRSPARARRGPPAFA